MRSRRPSTRSTAAPRLAGLLCGLAAVLVASCAGPSPDPVTPDRPEWPPSAPLAGAAVVVPAPEWVRLGTSIHFALAPVGRDGAAGAKAATWALRRANATSGPIGDIRPDGRYTAPTTAMDGVTTAVIALDADGRVIAGHVFRVGNAIPTLAPVDVDVEVTGTVRFEATLDRLPEASPELDGVVWSVGEVPGGDSASGTVDASGTYVAPASVPAGNPVTIRVRSARFPDSEAQARVTVHEGALPLVIRPRPGEVTERQQVRFEAFRGASTVQGVAWFVNGVEGGTEESGRIDRDGRYTAPETVGGVLAPLEVLARGPSPDQEARVGFRLKAYRFPPSADAGTTTPWGLALQVLLWAWIVLLPGLFLARFVLRDRRPSAVLLAALALGFGFMAAPVLAHAYLWWAGERVSLGVLLVPATVLNLAGLLWTWRRRSIAVQGEGPLPWIAAAVIVVAAFVTTDGLFPVASADYWKANGTSGCFMEGVAKYTGIHSHPHEQSGAGLPDWRAIDEKATMTNIIVAGSHVAIFGAPGFRFARCGFLLMLGLLGWLVWRHLGGSRRGALLGMAIFALNPAVLQVASLDRDVMALAFAALLFVLAEPARAPAIVLGLVAGFAGGLGVRMMPVVYLLPLALHLWFRKGNRARDLFDLFAAALVTLALSAPNFLGNALADYTGKVALVDGARRLAGFRSMPSFPYDLLGLRFESHYLLSFPFASQVYRGPDMPFPSFLFWPMHLLHGFGLAAIALSLLGAAWYWKRSRAGAVTLAFWGIPVYAGLSLMAIFVSPDQERLILMGLLPLLVLLVAGCFQVAAGWRSVVVGAVLVVALAGAARAACLWDAPVDPRFYTYANREYWFGPDEWRDLGPELGREARARYEAPSLLPSLWGWAVQEYEVIASTAAEYRVRAAALDAWQDLREPDLNSPCFLCRSGAEGP
jgi:hypothetical protein